MANRYKYNYIESNPSRTYTDLNFSFAKHPITNDVAKKTNEEAIKQNLKSLIYLGKNEKPFHPEIGGGIYDFLFENIAEENLDVILEKKIHHVLSVYEPRAEIRGVSVKASTERNGFNISVYFVVLNTLSPVTLDMFLKTVR